MARMTAPSSGVKVRMYRQGHGDCFLLAFAGREGRKKRTVYVLIDCGLKPKSEVKNQKIAEVIDDIAEATGGHVDVVVVTHEHQDHVNGFAKKKSGKHLFDKITFGQCWLAWTEDENDALANALRARFRDTLVTLAFAQEKALQAHGAQALQTRLADILDAETGDGDTAEGSAAEALRTAYRAAVAAAPLAGPAAHARAAIKGITNKRAMQYLRARAEAPPLFLRPDGAPAALPHLPDLRVYALGPPRDETLLLDLDPVGAEEFHMTAAAPEALALSGAAQGLALALTPQGDSDSACPPFSKRHRIPADRVFALPLRDAETADPADPDLAYLRRTYGGMSAKKDPPQIGWRRIDQDWLDSAEGLALRLNNEVNNTSLVLAFELPKTGKVLLFTGDAQRGNWIGWSDLSWQDDAGQTTSAKDLLGRCVLYKVGHHGSHNATLNGRDSDPHANIGWMARGSFADDFVAMIPANTAWALGKSQPWVHPLPQIEAALMAKAKGRVFRSDRDQIPRPDAAQLSDAAWDQFQSHINETDLFFEYSIEDRPDPAP